MLKLRGPEALFDLKVTGYEFPEAMVYDDANWLVIKIRVSDSDNSWEAVDSCLLTDELIELKSWFKNIESGQQVSDKISFLEGEIAFFCDTEQDILKVILNYAFHPKGGSYIYGEDVSYSVRFSLSRNLKGAISGIDDILEKFPRRDNPNYRK